MLTLRLVAVALATASLAAQPNFVLRCDQHEIAAARVAKDDPAQTVGRYRIAIEGGTLRSLGAGVPNWTASLAEGQRVSQLVASGHFGVVLPADDKGRPLPFLRVLDLGSGTWLQDLTPAPLAAPLQRLDGHAVVVARERVALLSFAGAEQATHAVVDAFTLGRREPAWLRLLPLELALGAPVRGDCMQWVCVPRPADQALQWLGECLLVSATSRDPLHLLSPYTGRTVWSVERVWEFARGFVGPSVCGHALRRFGVHGLDGADRKRVADLRSQLDARWTHFIHAGPVVVRRRCTDVVWGSNRGRSDAYSVFVVAARRPPLARDADLETVVYELNEHGQAVAIGNLPLLVHDGSHRVALDCVAWQCSSGGMLCLTSAAFGFGGPGMGDDNPDRLVHIAWLRQFEGARHSRFMRLADWREPPTLVGETLFWREDRNDDAPCARICATLLRDGSTTTWQVVADKDQAGATVERLSTRGDALVAHVVHQAEAYQVEFDLTGVGVFAPRVTERQAEREQARQTARAMLQAGRANAPDESPLFDAVGSSDTAVLRALLELGADPKAKSPVDWTPLMYAACYGSAEAVDVLIPVSDLAARDNNCGGQTVLIWATRSDRQSHRKLRALLDAGVDPNLATPKGWSPLMSAASAGNVLAVELLLARGADARARDSDGQTAADCARRRGYAALAEVLDVAARR